MTIHTHTPTPYTIEADTDPITIVDGNGEVVAYCGHSDIPANQRKADFIVRACNAHEALVGALKLHLQFLDSLPSGWLGKTTGDVGLLNDAYIASSKSLKLARGE